MKTTIALFSLILSLNSFAGVAPRVNCVGSLSNKVQEDKVLLEYRNGGAAFPDVFMGELKDYTFIVMINNTYSFGLGIYNTKSGEALIEKPVVLLANGMNSSVQVKVEDAVVATLSCSRLPKI